MEGGYKLSTPMIGCQDPRLGPNARACFLGPFGDQLVKLKPKKMYKCVKVPTPRTLTRAK